MLLLSAMLLACLATAAEPPQLSEAEASLLKQAEQAATPVAAVNLLRQGLTDASSPALRYAFAVYLHRAGDSDAAIAALQQTLAARDDFRRARELLATLLYAAGRHAEAVPELRRLVGGEGDRQRDWWSMLAWSFMALEQPSAADTAFRQALVQAPDDAALKHGLLQALLAQEKVAEALPMIQQALREEPRQPALWLLLADHALRQGDRIGATARLKSMQLLGIADRQTLLTLADLLLEQQLPEEALAIYTELAALADTPADRLLSVVERLLSLEQADAARQLLDAIPTALPDEHLVVRLRLEAALLAQAGDAAAALARYRQALTMRPLDHACLLGAGQLLEASGESAEARILYERLVRLDGETAYAGHLGLARLALAADDTAAAIVHLEAALKIERTPALEAYLRQLRERHSPR